MNSRHDLPWLTLAVCSLSLLLGLSPVGAALCELGREALARGEAWRLFTGHLVHFGGAHLAWDVAAFGLLGVLVEKAGRRRLVFTLVVSALACSGAVLACLPEIDTYRGLSGIDSALFGLLACDLLQGARRSGRPAPALLAGAALVSFAAKIVYEMGSGSTVFAATGGNFVPVPLAHLAGLAAGAAVSLLRAPRPFPGRGAATTSLTPQPRPDSFPTEVLHIPDLQSETSWRPTCSVTSPTTSASTSERPTRLST